MTATRDLVATLVILALAACLRHPWLQWLATAVAGRWLRGSVAGQSLSARGGGGLGFTATLT
ncbi:MAG: hypothetical protein VKS61_14560 [Candidatus Sericytochromatia bacterium]|nr:hypothetical protein [Candidatus Sericytochromatia bacterium]